MCLLLLWCAILRALGCDHIHQALHVACLAVSPAYLFHRFVASHLAYLLQLVQGLQLAVPLKVNLQLSCMSMLHHSRHSPTGWYSLTACDCCSSWMKVYCIKDFDEEGIYCADCWRWWHVEICWPATMDCMLMLAKKSLQDNPK